MVTGPIAFAQAIVGVINKKTLAGDNHNYRYFDFRENLCHCSIF